MKIRGIVGDIDRRTPAAEKAREPGVVREVSWYESGGRPLAAFQLEGPDGCGVLATGWLSHRTG